MHHADPPLTDGIGSSININWLDTRPVSCDSHDGIESFLDNVLALWIYDGFITFKVFRATILVYTVRSKFVNGWTYQIHVS